MAMTERKRPWYLVLALLGALALGTSTASSGWNLISLYRERIDPAQAGRGIADEGERAAVVSRFEAFLRALDADRSRGWPLGVGALVLGAAVTIFAMRALGGSRGARAALVQVVVAQAGLDVGSHFLLRDVEQAEMAARIANDAARGHDAFANPARAEEEAGVLARLAVPVFLGLRTIGSALVVLALTRRRSRDFFDAMAAAIEER
jgi:hypothetical protein